MEHGRRGKKGWVGWGRGGGESEREREREGGGEIGETLGRLG